MGTRLWLVASTVAASCGGNGGNTSADENRAPFAAAGHDQNVAVGALVTLDATASNDPDGDELTFSWSFTAKPSDSGASLPGVSTVQPSFHADREGVYVIELIVSDGAAYSSDSVVVTAMRGNVAPMANAGPDQAVATGARVTLDGSASSDADGDLLGFGWSFVTTPIGSTTTLSSTSAANPSFTADREGSYVIQLVVNDGRVDSAPDLVIVTAAHPNVAPTASAGSNQHVTTGALVTLDGTASTDPNGDTLSYWWTFTARPEGSSAMLSGATSTRPTFVADRDGSYVIQLIVNDGKLASDPDTVTVTAATANAAPVANAGADQSVATGTPVMLDGSASSDADGDLLTYAWAFTTKPAGSTATLSSATAMMPSFTADRDGSYVLRLVVSDGGLESAADSVTITASNYAPIANAGPDRTVATGSLVTLDGSASSDPNGDSLAFGWTLVARPNGSTASLSSTSAVMPTFVADRNGSYTFGLVVSDGRLDSAADRVTITASPTGPCAFVHRGVIGQAGALLPDGRIVTVGSDGLVASELRSFGSDASGGEQIAVFYGIATGLAVQADGHVVVAGTASTSDNVTVWRFDGSGVPDATFGSAGSVTYELGRIEESHAVALQTDGKILVAGLSYSYVHDGDVLLVRLNQDGTLDASFGTGGVALYDSGSWEFGGTDLAVQPDGKILVTGSTEHDLLLLRFTTNGVLDDSFGVHGVVTYGNASGSVVALQSDGRIVVGGSSPSGLLLLRYTTTGALDASFGSAGIVNDHPGAALSLLVEPDGKLVVGGETYLPDIPFSFALVARYGSDGTPDPSFATVTYNAGDGADSVKTLARSGDGGVVAVGSANVVSSSYGTFGELLVMKLFDACQ